jgi:hypothetical protein
MHVEGQREAHEEINGEEVLFQTLSPGAGVAAGIDRSRRPDAD